MLVVGEMNVSSSCPWRRHAAAIRDSPNFSMPQGHSLHPNGTLTEHTMDSTRAYTNIPGLDDGPDLRHRRIRRRPQLHRRGKDVLPSPGHLLRYTLLDVDSTLPRSISMPSKDPSAATQWMTLTIRRRRFSKHVATTSSEPYLKTLF